MNKSANIPGLETAVNDAKTISEILKTKYGFDVRLLLDGEATGKARSLPPVIDDFIDCVKSDPNPSVPERATHFFKEVEVFFFISDK